MSRRRLPADVYWTPRGGGVYVRWNGKPEGQVYVTGSKLVVDGHVDEAGRDLDGACWQLTPFNGGSGACLLDRILRLAADYFAA